MPIQQIDFVIPPSTAAHLNSGSWVRYGGIVRGANGQIVQHLKEVNAPGSSWRSMLASVKANRGLIALVVIVLGVVVTVLTFGLRRVWKKRRQQRENMEALRIAMAVYAFAIQNRVLTQGVVDDLMVALDRVDRKDAGAIDSQALEAIANYTHAFAIANGEKPKVKGISANGQLIDIQPYLNKQKEILSTVA